MQNPIPVNQNPSVVLIPFFEGKVRAGQSRFASAAQDYEMKELRGMSHRIYDELA